MNATTGHAQPIDFAADEACDVAPRHFTQTDLARRFQVSEASLERWRSEGIGPPFMKIGGRVRYRVTDVLEYEAGQLMTSTWERANVREETQAAARECYRSPPATPASHKRSQAISPERVEPAPRSSAAARR